MLSSVDSSSSSSEYRPRPSETSELLFRCRAASEMTRFDQSASEGATEGANFHKLILEDLLPPFLCLRDSISVVPTLKFSTSERSPRIIIRARYKIAEKNSYSYLEGTSTALIMGYDTGLG